MHVSKPRTRAAAALVAIVLGWLWTGAKLMMDWIGRSTVIDDAEHAQGLLAQFANWLFTTPWWVPAALATVLTLTLIFWLHPKEGADRTGMPSGEATVKRQLVTPENAASRLPPATAADERRPELKMEQRDPWCPQGLWVGEIKIDAKKLESELYIEIVIIGFNATGAAVSVEDVHGAIAFPRWSAADAGDLPAAPAPRICHERTKTANIEHLSEIFLVLDQRVPRKLAKTMIAQINSGASVQIDLKKLHLIVRPIGHPQISARLPLWAGVTIGRAGDRLITGKVVEASISGIVFAGSAITQRHELIRRWRNMLAEVARETREQSRTIREILLSNVDYLSFEPHLQHKVRRLVRTGSFNYGRAIVFLSDDEERMSHDDLVLYHLSNEIARIEREWGASSNSKFH